MNYVQGKIVGVTEKQGQPKKDEKTGVITQGNWYGIVGIQVDGKDYNGFPTIQTLSLNVYSDDYAASLHNSYVAYIGQDVLAPVRVQSGNNGGAPRYTLTGLPLKPAFESFAPPQRDPQRAAQLVAQAQAARAAQNTNQASQQFQAPAAEPKPAAKAA